MKNQAKSKTEDTGDSNPVLQDSTLPHGIPSFGKIKEEHFLPAVEQGIAQARLNIDAIKKDRAAPDFANTLVGLAKLKFGEGALPRDVFLLWSNASRNLMQQRCEIGVQQRTEKK